MTIQLINLGMYSNDGTGDDLRTAFEKVNNNLTFVDKNSITDTRTLGTGASIVTIKEPNSTIGSTLVLKSIASGNNTTVTTNANEIIISAKDSINSLSEDLNPVLAANLNLNSYNIISNGRILINSNSEIELTAINAVTDEYKNIILNGLTLNGNSILSTSLSILSESNLQLSATNINLTGPVSSTNAITAPRFNGDTNGLHTGPVVGNITGNLTGATNGIHTGSVNGNVSGQITDISNHTINELGTPDIATISANKAVVIGTSPLRLAQFTTEDRDLLVAMPGDMIYNITENKFQGFENDTWVNLV